MVIYKINFPNDKVYIGKTTKSIKKRISSHLSSSNNPKFPVHRAMKKYKGLFTVEIIASAESEKGLNKLECMMIDFYESFGKKGYNLTIGGEGTSGIKWTQESKDKLSNSRKGIKYSKETIQKMSDAKKGKVSPNKGKRGVEAPMWNKKHSKETLNKMSKSAEKRCKYFKAYNPEGKFIGVFKNMAKFEREYNLPRGTIRDVIIGRNKHSKKYTFKRID